MKLEIDYAQHPAFEAICQSSASSEAFSEYFVDMDKLWNLLADNKAVSDDAVSLFQDEHRRMMTRIEAELTLWADAEYRPFVIRALNASADAILKEALCVAGAKVARLKRSPEAEVIAQKLREISVVGFSMDSDLRARIANSLSPFMDSLRDARRSNGGARCFVAVPAWGEHWRLVKRFLKKNSIEEGISAYAGAPLELSGYALTYSHPDEQWFKRCYEDIGLDAPRTVQMHFDEENTSAKSMLYLNEIEKENGPFSYIPRSVVHVSSRSQLSFFKYLDFSHAEFAKSQAVDGGSYNRALFKSPRLRAHFARLPVELQGSSCLGDDILDNTALSDFLTENERQITSKVGDLALFAGGETLHRGGIVTQGERWALQMIYKPPLSGREKIKQHATSLLLRARNRYRELVN